MTDLPITNCPHCATPLPADALVCPNCRRLVFEERIRQLVTDAQRQESVDPLLAASTWQQSLAYIPRDTVEAHKIAARAAGLRDGTFHILDYSPPEQPEEIWQISLAKTLGSMALSIAVYSFAWGWLFAVGFVLLILIHELGHVVANRHYGIKQSAPFFLPFVGAVIVLRQNPPDAKAEAVIGIAGPVAGTFGAICCYALSIHFHNPILEQVASFAFMMNLFNLIPIWPLDGGRVAAGITPILWIPGALIFGWFMYITGGSRSILSLLIAYWVLRSTLPQIRDVVFRGGMRRKYYRIGAPARVAILVSYLLLASLLGVLVYEQLKAGYLR